MLTVAPLASAVHAGPSVAELIVTFRSVFNEGEKAHTHTDQSKRCFPADSMTCRETVDEGMYEPLLLPPLVVFIRVYGDFAKFRNVRTL